MLVIRQADERITKIWGKGKISSTASYRFLTYLFSVHVEDGILIHNGVTGEMIFLDKENEQKSFGLPCLYAPWMDELIEKHFIVKNEVDDKQSVDSLRLALRMLGTSKKITGYTILPTTCCNARCFYCYECGVTYENMSDTTADALAEFMKSHKGSETLHISWFGGEPLLGIRQIDRICRNLKDDDIPFRSSMISNGYLFDRKIAKRACHDWNLKSVQITLDGTENVYNRTKAYINPCESPYKRVIENIGFLLETGVKVNIRLNLGLHNIDDLKSLVLELANYFEDKTNLSVYVHVLFDVCGVNPIHFSAEERNLLVEEQKILYEYISQFASLGYKGRLPKLIANRCMADNASSLVVVPSGKLGKCEHYVQTHFVGSLESGVTEMQEVDLLRERVVFPKCPSCPLYPSCIKLKLCEPEKQHIEAECKLRIEGVMRTMKQHYKGTISVGAEDSFEC